MKEANFFTDAYEACQWCQYATHRFPRLTKTHDSACCHPWIYEADCRRPRSLLNSGCADHDRNWHSTVEQGGRIFTKHLCSAGRTEIPLQLIRGCLMATRRHEHTDNALRIDWILTCSTWCCRCNCGDMPDASIAVQCERTRNWAIVEVEHGTNRRARCTGTDWLLRHVK